MVTWRKSRVGYAGWLLLLAGAWIGGEHRPAYAGDMASPVEEIYVLRSVREERTMPPTDFCARARSRLELPAWEDNYSFRTIEVDAGDGHVANAAVKQVGTIHACFGRTADANLMQLYGEFRINDVTGKAFGPCHMTKSDFPEKNVRLFGCIFDLTDLPAGYVGGQLTTNSVTTPKITGLVSDPPGYTQVSIATIRLWKAR